jgi:DNA-binding transcriptional ArsR family regulator
MKNFTYEIFLNIPEPLLKAWRRMFHMKKGLTAICNKFFTNLANPTRLATLEKLMEKPMSVTELSQALGQEQSMISHNLKPLLQCRFIFSERKGRKRVYSVNRQTIDAIFRIVQEHGENFCPTKGKCTVTSE